MWILTDPLALLAPLSILGVLSLLILVVFYFCRFDQFRGVTLFRAILLLLFARLLDGATFILAAGGNFAEGELNLLYFAFSRLLPHSQAFYWSFAVSTLGVVAVVLLFWGFLRWGASKQQALRLALAFTAAASVISLVGAALNVFWVILGPANPFVY